MTIQSFIPSANLVVGAIIAGLVLKLINDYFKRRQLHVIVPKLFSFSQVSAGQIVELTILNRGTQSEESIEVQLSPKFSYTIIATTLPSITLSDDAILGIARLSKGEEVSVVLSAENGEFTPESVLSISSKHTKGEIKKKLEGSQEPTPA